MWINFYLKNKNKIFKIPQSSPLIILNYLDTKRVEGNFKFQKGISYILVIKKD